MSVRLGTAGLSARSGTGRTSGRAHPGGRRGPIKSHDSSPFEPSSARSVWNRSNRPRADRVRAAGPSRHGFDDRVELIESPGPESASRDGDVGRAVDDAPASPTADYHRRELGYRRTMPRRAVHVRSRRSAHEDGEASSCRGRAAARRPWLEPVARPRRRRVRARSVAECRLGRLLMTAGDPIARAGCRSSNRSPDRRRSRLRSRPGAITPTLLAWTASRLAPAEAGSSDARRVARTKPVRCHGSRALDQVGTVFGAIGPRPRKPRVAPLVEDRCRRRPSDRR